MKLSDVIATFLLDRGMTTGFGVIGSANSHLYDSIYSSGIRIVNMHHEQAAVMAAGAYYRASGKMSFVLVSAGGGITNAVTGLASLWADSIPVLVFSGQEATKYIHLKKNGRMFGTLGIDAVGLTRTVTKESSTIMDGFKIHNIVEEAYATALSNRRGPVLLDVPFDVQAQDTVHRLWKAYEPMPCSPEDTDLLQIEEYLKASQQPVILCGHGVQLSGSAPLFRSLLNHIRIPVVVSWSAISVLEHDHPLYFGSPGIYGQRSANFIVQSCDLLLVLGSRLTVPQTGYDTKEFARSAKIIMVDVDTAEEKDFAHLCIKADCAEFLRKFQAFAYYERPRWLDTCSQLRIEFPLVEQAHEDGIFPNSYRVIDRMSSYLRSDQIIVTDNGTAMLSGHQVLKLRERQMMFASYGLGEMGYGLPGAIGAAFAGGGREVLCLNGDGGLMMNLQELQTAISHRLRIKIVVFNNDGYLMIKHTQKMLFSGRQCAVDSSSGLQLPDFVKLCTAFGYDTFRIKSWSEFDFYFPRFMDVDGPAMCEIFMPHAQDLIPKVKGVVQNDGTIFAPPIEEMSPLLSLETVTRIMGATVSEKSSHIRRPDTT